ncbi:potassium transporter Kup [Raineyella sp. W15-4]|uniref:potassium transporter Kup n=1 Tax=Raineyella sp. W15-4 TaxID=3081651 RepID=UPI00295498DD|nr:potassium transporter Kup [Raineyella sp. W15-4]WOQ18444.1 potassium transporter Kup [Raineyella sp. W15-4]
MRPLRGGDRTGSHKGPGQDPDTTTITPLRGRSKLPALALTALGVVFGDIGTSPLYSMQTVFSIDHNNVKPVPVDVYGVISMVLWSITLVVTFKYVVLVMRADNDGEGGILALTHLLVDRVQQHRRTSVVLALGMLGAALFYGDSVITPAISVMSAIEGLTVVNPGFEDLVLPLSVVILSVLFVIQRWGTAAVGRAFGPVMTVWFVVVGLLGVPHIVQHPGILRAVSPTYAVAFVVEHPFTAFIAMGAVVLTITGAEALYADMGHFGPLPIKISWFAIVFPALALNYLGQGAMILHDPATINNPFFQMAPSWSRLPLVVLATLATVIASQAVISGAFSVSRQAVRLGLLPRLLVKHTSKEEGGQIFVPLVNWVLYLGVLALIAIFGSSANLASAYGLAVTGTLLLTSLLFLALAHMAWQQPTWKLVVYAATVLLVEVFFFAANLAKVVSGGWLPLLIAALVILVMTTWRRGFDLVSRRRRELEGPLDEFIEAVHNSELPRIPGIAVFPHPNSTTAPLALRTLVMFTHAMFEHVVLVEIVNENVPHIRHRERVHVHDLGDPSDGIVHISVHVGFNDSQDVPRGLALAVGRSPELDFEPQQVRYFLSVLTLRPTGDAKMASWRKRLYVLMANNAASRTEVFHLPPDRTVVMGAEMEL